MSFKAALQSLTKVIALLSSAVSCLSNEAPSISRILDHSTLVCTPISIPFTISDPDNAPEQLILSASSNNTNLLGSANISLVGTGTNRSVTLLISGEGVGTVTVTIAITDGEAETTTSFNLSVINCGGPPTLSPIADVTMRENSTVQIPLISTFCDRCLSTSPITWFVSSTNTTLFPASSISIPGNDTNATLVLTPTGNQTGPTRLTVSVSDGASTVSGSFNVTVTSVGTWTDHFEFPTLDPAWIGTKSAFFVTNGVLEGESASPLAPSPFNFLELPFDSTDCDVSCWINVVARNTRVCTKGALLLRHTATNGYVFALHEATQTIELYRLTTHEMLFEKSARIDLGKWYHLRARLNGPTISLYVDDHLVGTVVDALYPAGSVGLAVQDAETVRFDDFTVTGANILGNTDSIQPPELRVRPLSINMITLHFFAAAPYNYRLQAASAIFSHDWQTLDTFTAKLQGFEAEFSESITNSLRFYRVEKFPCNCR
jgi:hypothetical protein